MSNSDNAATSTCSEVERAAVKLTCRCRRRTPRCVPPSGRSASASVHKAFFPSVQCEKQRQGLLETRWQTPGRRPPLLAWEVRRRKQRTLTPAFKAEPARLQRREETLAGETTHLWLEGSTVSDCSQLFHLLTRWMTVESARASLSSGFHKFPRSASKRRNRDVATPARTWWHHGWRLSCWVYVWVIALFHRGHSK